MTFGDAIGAIFSSDPIPHFICRTCIAHSEWGRAIELITTRKRGHYRCQRCMAEVKIEPRLEPIEVA